MNKKDNLKKASAYYLIGTLFNKGIGFLTVPIFTRILTVEDYGIVTTYNSWVSILMVLISLTLYMSVRNSFVDYKEETNNFLTTILLFTMLHGLIISIVTLSISICIPDIVNPGIVFFCMLQALGTALIENCSQFLMMKYRFKFRTLIMVLPNFASTITAIFLIKKVFSTELYFGRIIPSSLITFSIGFMLAIYFLSKGRVCIKGEYLVYGLKISLPLVLHGIALNILSQSDRTMISLMRNNAETGIYGLIYNFSMIATVITTAFEGIWIPFFIRKMKENNIDQINKMSTKYIELMTIAMCGVTLVGPEIVKILSTEIYWEGILIIPPIVLSNFLIFSYSLYVNVEHYYKKTIFVSINTLIAATSNIIMNYYFISLWGYVGAAYSTLISYGLSLLLHYIYSRKLNKEVIPLKEIIIPVVIIMIIVVAFYIFINMWFIRWLIALICSVSIVYKERVFLLNLFRRKNVQSN